MHRKDEALIRARKIMEAEQDHYRTFFDLASDGCVISDIVGTVKEVNRAATSLLQREASSLLGTSFVEVFPPTEQGAVLARLMRLRATRQTEMWETSLTLHEGQPFATGLSVSVKEERTGDREVLCWVLRRLSEPLRETIIPSRTLATGALAEICGITSVIQTGLEERQRTEELRLCFSTAVEVSADIIVIGDLEGKILHVNEAAWRWYGAENSREMIGKDALSLVIPEDRGRATAALAQAIKTGRAASEEFYVINCDGVQDLLEASVALLRNDRGEALGVIAVLRNVTERKHAEESLRRAHDELEARVRERTAELERINAALREEVVQRQCVEEALRESEARAQALFENASDAIALLALDGTTVNVNRGAEILLRYNRSEIIGRSYTEFLTPASLQLTAERFQRAAAGERLLSLFELELIRKDGSIVPVEARTRFLRDQNGTVTGILGIYRDITARKQIEEALRRSEERYRELFENANDMITTIALDGIFLSVNRRTEQLLGYSREELIGQDSHRVATPASAAVGDERTRRVFAGEAVPPMFALDLVRRDGTIVPVEARIRFMRDQEGKPIGFHGIYRDVTERKRAEEALQKAHDELEDRVQVRTEELVRANAALLAEVTERKRAEEAARAAEEEYRSIFENATEGIYRSSLDGHQLRANPALVKLNGYDSEEEQLAAVNAITTKWYVDPHRRGEFKRLLEEYGQVTNFESEIDRHKIRERIWISENARLVRNKDGSPLYYEGTVQDITARKRAEEALRQAHAELEQRVQERTTELMRTNMSLQVEIAERKRAEEELARVQQQNEQILNSAGEGILGIDRAGHIAFVNPSAAAMLGSTVHELLGQSLHETTHHSRADGSAYPSDECSMLRTLQDGLVVYETDDLYWRKDATHFPVESICAPILNEHREVAGAVVTFQDITQRKEVDRMKDELISTVSHELRTPLASLRGFTELLLGRTFPSERQQEFLTIIHNESLRLTKLINDFLDLQRIESGCQPYAFAALAVDPLLRDAVAVFSTEGGVHELRLDLPPTLPPVLGDRERLRQVLSNLLSNAIKFSPKGGEVLIGARPGNGVVVFRVQDHGVGIPKEAVPKLFHKFYRVDNTATRDIGGTGLGLTLVKELIAAHHGQVWVESTLGKGSTFFFTVPVAVGEQ